MALTFTPPLWRGFFVGSLVSVAWVSGLLRRPAQYTADTTNTSGLMAKPKTKDDEIVEALLKALAEFNSGKCRE